MIQVFRTAILRTDLWGQGRTIEFYYDGFDPVPEKWEETEEDLFYTEPAIVPAFEVQSEVEPIWVRDEQHPRGTMLDRMWDGKRVKITYGKKVLVACGSLLLHYARNLDFGLSIVTDRWNETPIMIALGETVSANPADIKPKAKTKKKSDAEFDLFGDTKKPTRKRKAKA